MPLPTTSPLVLRPFLAGGGIARVEPALRARLAAAKSLEASARAFVDLLTEEVGDALALARVYVAMPLYRLSPREQAFAHAVAASKGAVAHGETSVLTLMATRGARAAWNDRAHSQGHVAIPLVDARFVEGVPMVAALLRELGLDLAALDEPRDLLVRRLVGGLNGTFYVADARTARDAGGRLIIPAQDFVAEQGVRTVFGLGGAYLNGWIEASIFFTREELSQAEAAQFNALAAAFKLATMGHVAAGAIFER